ncbi:MAG TPA: hypothetical protein PKW33_11790 [Anaerolineaceae bacterium]|nr:hypothetical protein [Anaerolineaceae bacterium]HPN52261.1 hypothetical protein [Anaerolineaceae bacterium]
MFIESVELRNIKSYATPPTRVLFRNGVNLIWGDNGSGKTTILESIGYALFGVNNYNISQFIREGEDEGEIVLTFEARDERMYQVVRNLKKTAKIEIIDPVTRRKITSRKQDAEDWITDNLGIENQDYGKQLFENALGVAQGKMTGSFLETESARKSIFAPILRVDDYDNAWKELQHTAAELSIRIRSHENEISRLEGRLENLPQQEQQLDQLERQTSEGQVNLSQQKKLLTKKLEEALVFENARGTVDRVERDLLEAKHQLALLAEQLLNAEAAWKESDEAAEALQNCQQGHDLYLEASAQKKELLAQQALRNEGQKKLSQIDLELKKVLTSLEHLSAQLENVQKAEADIQALEPLVAEQISLEALIEQLKKQESDYLKARADAVSTSQKAAQLQRQLDAMQQELARRKEVEDELAATQSQLDQQKIALSGVETDASNLNNHLRDIADKLQEATLHNQHRTDVNNQMQRITREIDAARKKCIEVEKQLQERAELSISLQNLEEEILRQTARVNESHTEEQVFEAKMKELQSRIALLGNEALAECPVCRRKLEEHQIHDIAAEFKAEIASLAERLQNARRSQHEAQQKMTALRKEETEQKKRREKLPAEARLEEIQLEITQKEIELSRLNQEMAALSEAPRLLADLEEQKKTLTLQSETLQSQLQSMRKESDQTQKHINGLNAELARLARPTQADDLQSRVSTCQKEIEAFQTVSNELAGIPAQLASQLKSLKNLNDPRARKAELTGIAGQRVDIETQREKLTQQEEMLNQQRQKQEQSLQIYAGLDQTLIDVDRILNENEKAYQSYLGNQQAASMLSQRIETKARHQENHAVQLKMVAELENGLSAAQAGYDAKKHATLQASIEHIKGEIKKLDAQLVEWQKQCQQLQTELQKMRLQAIELAASKARLERLNHLQEVFKFVREGIHKAGPQIVRQRVKVISSSADQIFQDIIGDPSLSLSWDETYAIKVRNRKDERIFNQLSGGEQMGAAIAVRLAIMILMSDLRFLFLDEPTANMDDIRRDKLADRITRLEGLKQIFVITHDDAFRRDTHHFIQVTKESGISRVEIGR